jgi:hypothetical protein
MSWYMSITCQIIIPKPARVPSREEMEYESHAH